MSVTVTDKERRRLYLIRMYIQGRISLKEASWRMRVSSRQVLRLVKSYCEDGTAAIISKRRGKPSPRKLPEPVREKLFAIAIEHPNLKVSELFQIVKDQNITISCECLRLFLLEKGLRKIKKRKAKRQSCKKVSACH